MKMKCKQLLIGFGEKLTNNHHVLEKEFDEEEIGKAFGVAMKIIRKYKKVTLKQLESELDIPHPTLSRYENGIIIPSISQSIKISSYFDISAELMVYMGLCSIYENTDIAKQYEKLDWALKSSKLNRTNRRKK